MCERRADAVHAHTAGAIDFTVISQGPPRRPITPSILREILI